MLGVGPGGRPFSIFLQQYDMGMGMGMSFFGILGILRKFQTAVPPKVLEIRN
jgi:hypothetical protein